MNLYEVYAVERKYYKTKIEAETKGEAMEKAGILNLASFQLIGQDQEIEHAEWVGRR